MTAVDAVSRYGSRLDNAGSGLVSTVARSGRSDVGVGQQDRAALRRAADPWTRANPEVDAFALAFCQLFSSAGTRAATHRTAARPGDEGDREVGEDPAGMYFLAATFVGGQRTSQAATLLHRLDTLTAQRSDRHEWRRRVEFLWAAHAERSADSAAVLDHCAAANLVRDSGPSVPSPPGPNHDGFLHAVDAVISDQLPLLAISAHIRLGQAHLAQALLESHFGSQDRAEASQPAAVALLASQQGRLNDAQRLAIAAWQSTKTPEGPIDLLELEARQTLAQVCFERNELDAARDYLETALRRCWPTCAAQHLWAVEADLVRVMIARQPAGALHRLQTLRRAIASEPVSRPLTLKLNRADLDARVALGDLDGAVGLVRSLPAPELPWDAVVRLDLCVGRPDRALTRLASASPRGLAAEIRQLVLRACGERQEGRWPRARDTMYRAVEVARPEHYVRPFLETPTLTVALLRSLRDSHPDPYLSELVSQAEQLAAPTQARHTVGMLEPLTERERQVLGHLSSHHNLPQIGAVMGLSTNTIKTHVKSIYRKTGAASRDDAVTIARSHGLL
jgi:DNA-binding CsgD family transcriptional regulator